MEVEPRSGKARTVLKSFSASRSRSPASVSIHCPAVMIRVQRATNVEQQLKTAFKRSRFVRVLSLLLTRCLISNMFLFFLFFSFTLADILANTASGALRGFSPFPNVHAFLGIPYAQPPIGKPRFAPPQPLNGSAGVRKCYRSSPGCFQHQVITAVSDRETGIAESEDVLTVNIVCAETSHDRPDIF